jgi:hypothetical protein
MGVSTTTTLMSRPVYNDVMAELRYSMSVYGANINGMWISGKWEDCGGNSSWWRTFYASAPTRSCGS